jgi:hypothetical protein
MMVLTKRILRELEESLWVRLTPEQRAILFLWHGSDCEYGWTREDFVYGIHKVIRHYPDHRPKPLPDFLLKDDLGDEPF